MRQYHLASVSLYEAVGIVSQVLTAFRTGIRESAEAVSPPGEAVSPGIRESHLVS